MSVWSTADLARMKDAGINASAAPQQRVLAGSLLRFSPGKAKRARCVNALSTDRLALAEKVALCEQLYRQAGLPLIVRVTLFSKPEGLDETFAEMGWRRFDDTPVMVLADLTKLGAASLAERLRHAPVPHRGFVAQRGSATLACGQYVVESDCAGLYDVFTAPPFRGRRLARELCRELLLRAYADGARRAYLQVEGDNRAARAAYQRLGFVDGYAYHYRTLDPEAA